MNYTETLSLIYNKFQNRIEECKTPLCYLTNHSN